MTDTKQKKFDISDQDIYSAMEKIPGYLDITPGDFKELYKIVYHETVARIVNSLTAEALMSSPVITVPSDTLARHAAKIMAEKNISGVPVVDEANQMIGMLSERNFLGHMGAEQCQSFLEILAQSTEDQNYMVNTLQEKTAFDIMTSPVISVSPTTPLSDITHLFKIKRIKRVPVVDQEGALVGIISREDIIHTSLLQP